MALARFHVRICLLTLAMCWSPSAYGDDAERMTERGRLMPGGAIGGYWSNNADSPGLTRYRNAALWVEPSLSYFFWPYVGLGLYGGFGWWRDSSNLLDSRSRVVSAGLHFLGELPLGRRLGLLLLVQLGYGHERQALRTLEGWTGSFFRGRPGSQWRSPPGDWQCRTWQRLELGVRLPLLVHLSSHVALGVGPTLSWTRYLASNDPGTSVASRPDGSSALRIGVSTFIGCSF